jgi:hypothetical protein
MGHSLYTFFFFGCVVDKYSLYDSENGEITSTTLEIGLSPSTDLEGFDTYAFSVQIRWQSPTETITISQTSSVSVTQSTPTCAGNCTHTLSAGEKVGIGVGTSHTSTIYFGKIVYPPKEKTGQLGNRYRDPWTIFEARARRRRKRLEYRKRFGETKQQHLDCRNS